MGFSANQIALAARLLSRFGANGTLARAPAYHAGTDRMTSGDGTTRTVRMVVGPMETLDEQGREVFRTVAKMQVEPARGDTIVFGGTTYTVGNVTAVAPQGLPIIYFAEVA